MKRKKSIRAKRKSVQAPGALDDLAHLFPSPKGLKEFDQILKTKFGIHATQAEVERLATKTLRLGAMLMKLQGFIHTFNTTSKDEKKTPPSDSSDHA